MCSISIWQSFEWKLSRESLRGRSGSALWRYNRDCRVASRHKEDIYSYGKGFRLGLPISVIICDDFKEVFGLLRKEGSPKQYRNIISIIRYAPVCILSLSFPLICSSDFGKKRSILLKNGWASRSRLWSQ